MDFPVTIVERAGSSVEYNYEILEWLATPWGVFLFFFFFGTSVLKLALIYPRRHWRTSAVLLTAFWLWFGGFGAGIFYWLNPELLSAALGNFVGFGILIFVVSYFLGRLRHRDPENRFYHVANKVLSGFIALQLGLTFLSVLFMLYTWMGLKTLLFWLVCLLLLLILSLKIVLWFRDNPLT